MTSAAKSSAAPFKWKSAPVPSDPDRIKILDSWDILNIGSFACEELSRWTHGKSRIVTMNHSCKDSFLALWRAWEKEGVLEVLKADYTPAPTRALVHDGWGGAYNPRYKRGVAHDQNPNHLSNHASGHAFDIATRRYPLGAKVAGPDPIQLLVPIAEAHGWKWGGRFSRPDPMHFQHVTSPFT